MTDEATRGQLGKFVGWINLPNAPTLMAVFEQAVAQNEASSDLFQRDYLHGQHVNKDGKTLQLDSNTHVALQIGRVKALKEGTASDVGYYSASDLKSLNQAWDALPKTSSGVARLSRGRLGSHKMSQTMYDLGQLGIRFGSGSGFNR